MAICVNELTLRCTQLVGFFERKTIIINSFFPLYKSQEVINGLLLQLSYRSSVLKKEDRGQKVNE